MRAVETALTGSLWRLRLAGNHRHTLFSVTAAEYLGKTCRLPGCLCWFAVIRMRQENEALRANARARAAHEGAAGGIDGNNAFVATRFGARAAESEVCGGGVDAGGSEEQRGVAERFRELKGGRHGADAVQDFVSAKHDPALFPSSAAGLCVFRSAQSHGCPTLDRFAAGEIDAADQIVRRCSQLAVQLRAAVRGHGD